SAMAVKTEKELSEAQRNLWLKAVAAVELRNLGYAISLLQEILKQEPQFLMGRQLLRRAEVTKKRSTKRSFLNISTAPIGIMNSGVCTASWERTIRRSKSIIKSSR